MLVGDCKSEVAMYYSWRWHVDLSLVPTAWPGNEAMWTYDSANCLIVYSLGYFPGTFPRRPLRACVNDIAKSRYSILL